MASAALFATEIIGDSSPFKHNQQSGRIPLPRRAQSLSQDQVVLKPHFVRPLPHKSEHGTEERMPAKGQNGRPFQEQINERSLAKQVADALVVDFGQFKATHKRIAQIAGASEKTAENWTSGMNTPHLVYFLRLLPHSPALQGVVRKLCQMESEIDPNFQQAFTAFMQLVGREGLR